MHCNDNVYHKGARWEQFAHWKVKTKKDIHVATIDQLKNDCKLIDLQLLILLFQMNVMIWQERKSFSP